MLTRLYRITCAASIAALVSMTAAAGTATPTTKAKATVSAADQKINSLIQKYIMDHPEDILKSVKMYQVHKQQEQRKKMYETALAAVDDLRTAQYQTIAGNPNGSVTMVEFFDYQCVMCWRAYKGIDKVVDKNPNVRVIYRFLPIFGKASEYAAKVDLVAAKQGRYAVFHDKMFKAKRIEGKLRNKDVRKAAKQSGVKLTSATKKMMNGEASTKFIKHTADLASKLGITGTPMFYIMPTKGKVTTKNFFAFNGAVPPAYLQKAIDVVSGKKDSKKKDSKKKGK